MTPTSTATSTAAPGAPVYTVDALLALAQSPLSRLPIETRDALRVSFPELITNRKQRKAIEYHNNMAQLKASMSQPRRTRPLARASGTERKRNASMLIEEAGWRGRIPTAAIPVALVAAAA